jgi:hypothetical protein
LYKSKKDFCREVGKALFILRRCIILLRKILSVFPASSQ